jgi:hypothetical protein
MIVIRAKKTGILYCFKKFQIFSFIKRTL